MIAKHTCYTKLDGKFQNFRNVREYSRAFEKVLEISRMFQNIPEFSRMFQNILALLRHSRTFREFEMRHLAAAQRPSLHASVCEIIILSRN